MKPIVLAACERGERSSKAMADALREHLNRKKINAEIHYAGVIHYNREQDAYTARPQGAELTSEPELIPADKVAVFVSASASASTHFRSIKRPFLKEDSMLLARGILPRNDLFDKIVAALEEKGPD